MFQGLHFPSIHFHRFLAGGAMTIRPHHPRPRNPDRQWMDRQDRPWLGLLSETGWVDHCRGERLQLAAVPGDEGGYLPKIIEIRTQLAQRPK